jgi:Kef-type K+ transport system membrane component KefB
MTSLLADATAAESLLKLDVESLLLPVLVQLAVIVAAARAFGALARRLGQPAVVGEIAAGLLLGPSLFGWVSPEWFAAVFRPGLPGVEQALADAVLPKIFNVVAQFGLIFLMFLVGLELEPGHVRDHGRAVVLVALAGLAVPFALGAGLGLVIHPHLEPHPVAGAATPAGVAIFTGLTLSVTAIPVLGRIMLELNVTRTRLGAVTLAAAGISDACGWILLASAAALIHSHFDPTETLRMAGLTVGFALAMWLVARPLLVRYFAHSLRANRGQFSTTALAVLLVSILLSAVATNLIGIFAVFGAFALGAALSDQPDVHRAAAAKLRDLVTSFFVPVFFTYTGLRTDITALSGGTLWLLCGALAAAAALGKLAGCGLAARASGFTWKESAIVGAMMNARGLMALVAINIGYELGVIPRSLFCMLVIMALATTLLTTPLLLLLRKGTEIEEAIAQSGFLGAERGEVGLEAREAAPTATTQP